MVWLVLIAVNLVTTGHFFDVALRDVVMAIAAYALARLTEAHEASLIAAVPAPAPAAARRAGSAA
jgi:hypothetical protein